MSNWIQQIENHQVHNDIRSALSPIQEILSNSDDLEVEITERLDRIERVIKELKNRLNAVDPYLISIQQLNGLHNPLINIESNLSSFINNKNASHINNAFAQIDNIIAYLAQIPIATSVEDIEALRDSAVGLRRSLSQHARRVEEEGEEAQAELESLRSEIKRLKEEVEAQSASYDQFIATLRSEFDESEKGRNKTFEETLEDYNASIKEAFDAKKSDIDELAESINMDFDSLKDDIKEKANTTSEMISDQAEEIISKIMSLRDEAQRLVGIITDTGMVGGYQKIANSEKSAATFWRVTAFVSLLILVGFAIILFIVSLHEGFKNDATLTITRSFVALSIAILAGYAARQADKHEKAQRKHRKMELELASISPYLHDFPEEESRKIKTDLAMKIFAQKDDTPADSKVANNSLTNLLEISLKSLQSLISKQ